MFLNFGKHEIAHNFEMFNGYIDHNLLCLKPNNSHDTQENLDDKQNINYNKPTRSCVNPVRRNNKTIL